MRSFVFRLGLVSAVSCAAMSSASAQSAGDYPERAVTIVAPYGPGTAVDIPARIIAQGLSETLRQPVVVVNRPGAGGTIGAEIARTSKPDGYTLLFLSPGLAISQSLYPKLPYDLGSDFAPITLIGSSPNVLLVQRDAPTKSLAEFIQYAQGNPERLHFGSTGNGSSPHLSAEMFNQMAGTRTVHVPYRNFGDGLTDLVAGRIQFMFATLPSAMSYSRAGQVKVLAVTSAKRHPALPDVPTVAELVPGYELSGWFGFAAPRDTPQPILDKLHASLVAVLAQPAIRGKLSEQGIDVVTNTPQEFSSMIRNEIGKWGKVIKTSGMKID